MSAPATLKDLYVHEMQDLWSANDQMTKTQKQVSEQASDDKLKKLLTSSVDGIGRHTSELKSLIEAKGSGAKPDHCKGMEGLVAEALKHGAKEAPEDKGLRDIVIISQYRRISHYGTAGFGPAAANAKALGKEQGAKK